MMWRGVARCMGDGLIEPGLHRPPPLLTLQAQALQQNKNKNNKNSKRVISTADYQEPSTKHTVDEARQGARTELN